MEEKKKRWLRRKPETMLDWIIIVFAGIVFYMVLSNIPGVTGFLEQFMAILTPFAAGVAIAYIINPVVEWSYKYICRSHPKLHWLAMLIGYIVAIAVVGVLGYLIVTQVITALTTFAANLTTYQKNLEGMVLALQPRLPESWDVQPILEYVQDLTKVMRELIVWVLGSGEKLMSFFNDAVDTFVLLFTAIAASVYLLIQKDYLLRGAKILVRAFLPQKVANNVLRICRQANHNLSGFFSGKIIDSAIIGVLTFICMSLFRMSFAPVISIIVGVTNIIPVFGPFIGAIPGILLLLFIDPMQALIFAILILVIQQLDGNVIGPAILGDSIGMSALWVLVSIVVCGDLFGLPGMVIGVPLFATLLSIVKELAEWCLRYQGIDKEGNPLTPPKSDSDAPGAPEETAPAAEAPQPAKKTLPHILPKNRKTRMRS